METASKCLLSHLSGHCRPFTLMFFEKSFGMLSQCLVTSITKKVISYLLVLGQQPLTGHFVFEWLNCLTFRLI